MSVLSLSPISDRMWGIVFVGVAVGYVGDMRGDGATTRREGASCMPRVGGVDVVVIRGGVHVEFGLARDL